MRVERFQPGDDRFPPTRRSVIEAVRSIDAEERERALESMFTADTMPRLLQHWRESAGAIDQSNLARLLMGVMSTETCRKVVLAFADASLWPHRLGSVTLFGLTLRGWVVTIVLHLLLGGGSFIIALARVHWVQRRGAARETREEDRGHG